MDVDREFMVAFIGLPSELIDCGRTADMHLSQLGKAHMLSSQHSRSSMIHPSREEEKQTTTPFGEQPFTSSKIGRLPHPANFSPPGTRRYPCTTGQYNVLCPSSLTILPRLVRREASHTTPHHHCTQACPFQLPNSLPTFCQAPYVFPVSRDLRIANFLVFALVSQRSKLLLRFHLVKLQVLLKLSRFQKMESNSKL
jgi:hypothetical protein